ncbi:MAG: Gfo/Idh/MocA family oxidoreductase [Caulobacteraceae bacterium]
MNLVIVGAGNGGKNIIESLSKIDDIKIVQVVDNRGDAPGVVLAKKLGISCLQSIDEISTTNVDLIIEATGAEKVKQELNGLFRDKCTIIDSVGALLIMTLVKRDIEVLDKLNNQISAVKDTSTQVQNYLRAISASIDNTYEINKKLNEIAKQQLLSL